MVKKEYTSDWVVRAQKIAHLGIWDQDLITEELWWSDETFRILGIEPQSMPPDFNKFLEMVHPDDRTLIINQTKLAKDSDKNPYKVEYRIIWSDNSEHILHEEALIERDEKGVPTKMTGIIQDITERVRFEKEREKLIEDLQKAVTEIKTLHGILPVCCVCGLIRDDAGVGHGEGEWMKMARFVTEKTDAQISHSYCPHCFDEAEKDI